MKRLAILDGVRTPFCKAGTLLRELPAHELGRIAVKELLARTGVDPRQISEVILGNVAQPAEAANIARVIALTAGVPEAVPARTVHRNCASGMEALTAAAEKMLAGGGDLFLVGGVESMSNIPLYYPKSAWGKFEKLARAKTFPEKLLALGQFRPSDFRPQIGVALGLTDPVPQMNMGQTAEVLAKEFLIPREEQDALALESHRRVIAARARLREEMMTLYAPPDFQTFVSDDNGAREDTSLDALANLRPIFDPKFGSVTAGNSSQITDGAVALLVASEERAQSLGIEPLGYLRAWHYAGLEPQRMGLGPAHAIPPALKTAGVAFREVQLWEINEAFAAQVLASLRVLASKELCRQHLGLDAVVGEIPRDRLNVNGGAIALGHPVGASGARLVLTLLKEMKRRNLNLGVASLCVGGGQGAALVLER